MGLESFKRFESQHNIGGMKTKIKKLEEFTFEVKYINRLKAVYLNSLLM